MPVPATTTSIALVGCGFVADYYLATLANHRELAIVGVWDREAARLERFCAFHKLPAFAGLDAALASTAAIVVNLTTPESHFAVNRAALEAGKHVYCEKPLALAHDELARLVELARARGLDLDGAPANALSAAARETRRQLAGDAIGAPRLVYAEMEDGPVFRDRWRDWRSASGAPWPGEHEFETGCTLEHAGYALSWLVMLFGPVRELRAFAHCAFPDKGVGDRALAADYTVASLVFDRGVAARLTCGLAAERKRSLTIHGERGVLTVDDLWDHQSTVRLAPLGGAPGLARRALGKIERVRQRASGVALAAGRPVRYPRDDVQLPGYPSRIDFMAGVAAQAARIARGRPEHGERAAHVSEIALATQAGAALFRPRFAPPSDAADRGSAQASPR